MLLEQQKIFEEKILNNQMLTGHNLLGYIDRKLQNNGEIFVDMSSMGNIDGSGLNFAGHPYELEQIEGLLKVDQAKFFAQKLE
mgnify:FL=1